MGKWRHRCYYDQSWAASHVRSMALSNRCLREELLKPSLTNRVIHTVKFINTHRCVKTPFNRARRICRSDTLDSEITVLTKTLMANGYPEKFINVHSKPTGSKPTSQTVPREPLYLTLQYKDDITSEDTKRKLKAAIARNFPVTELRWRFKTRGYHVADEGINLSTLFTSHVVDQFTCSCGEQYIDGAERCLSQRIAEHIPKYIRSLMDQQTPTTPNIKRNPTSSIAKYILDTRHKVDSETCLSKFCYLILQPWSFTILWGVVD